MVRSPALRSVSVLGLASLLLLAGCSDDTDDAAEGATGSPLEEYMGTLFEMDPADMAADQVEMENLISTCMSEKGFEYVPMEVSEDDYDWATEDEAVDRETAEWVAENGYGMSMSEEEPVDESEEPPADPNADYLASLSEGAQTAFNEALYGPDVWSEMTEEEAMEYEYRWEDGGCQGAASHEVDMTGDLFSDPAHAELMEAMNALWEDQMDDPRVVELNTEWADCMADAGYTDFTSPDDAQTSVMEAQNALWENMDVVEDSPESMTGPSDEALAEVREVEIATASADFACKEEISYTDEMTTVQHELEKQFVTDHKAQLDAFIAAVESAESK